MAQRSRATTDALLAPDVPTDTSETERLRAERDHRRHMFDQLATQFPDAGIVADGEGRLTHWNREQERFAGIDALGRPVHEATGTENKAGTLAETVARTGEAVRESDVRTIPQPDGKAAHCRAGGAGVTRRLPRFRTRAPAGGFRGSRPV
ncbi:hypothetical protein GCM10008995_11460 [Halobellus salinus]|uniref:PAS domain-containing protein n=1 Tax=Halobellus salinus TaxID=931585 RepID=A0A830E9F7_9EURY|nr:PAS domain S-box protein [Halobellus salinus]GGJ03420.1 hypothetical protein GCM10008995_11460 [Halobellus salinus]SMP21405.1 PAS domain S-box-containing protein [Halobellus salinus]